LIMREHLFTCHNVKYQWIVIKHGFWFYEFLNRYFKTFIKP
jgi:hypothetical protein